MIKIEKKIKTLEEHKIEVDGVKITVKILGKEEKATKYNLLIQEVSFATRALLEDIRHELITEVGISTSEIFDPKIIEKLKEKFKKRAETILTSRLAKISKESKTFLIGNLIREMVGLGNLEFLLNDPSLEEIVIPCTKENIRVYHKKYGWLETNINVETEEQIANYANIIARRVGRQITTLSPLLDAHLISGDRANAVLYPICVKGNTMTIRKFARDPWTITDFIKNQTISVDLAALLWLSVQYELNVIVTGGTASGKTSLLNTMMPFIPPNQRIITIEQTRELQLPKFLFWCPLVTRLPNPEGKGGIDMLDLLINSLRMRPDRIILGEIRRKDEAEVLFEAMHTGHAVYATLHADSLVETEDRLTTPPISVPKNLMSAIDLCIVMFRDRRSGLRRIYQVGEFLVTDSGDKTTINSNLLYRWKQGADKIVAHSKSIKLFDNLSRHTGLSLNGLNKDLEIKKKILNYMVKNNIRDVEEVGKLIANYYLDPKIVLDRIKGK